MLKRAAVLLMCLCLLSLPACAEEAGKTVPVRDAETEKLLEAFTLKHGSREKKMVAFTVDDCYQERRQYIVEDVELCRQYGVRMTFFPVYKTGCLQEKFRDIWQSVLDAGCEIGCHGYQHMHLGSFDYWTLIKRLGRWQEELDKTLGYHYETRWLRPPYGSIEGGKKLSSKQLTGALKRYGFDHIVHWEISQTDPDKALKKIQPGSILLFHANNKDTRCMETLIPILLEEGYQIVTVSEMFGFDPPETSEELYVYDRKNYEDA
jgi:Predicted xylanase/chitin deacetylase